LINQFPEFLEKTVVAERSLLEKWNGGVSHLEYWNNGILE